jgi:hypothetical protein
MLGGALDRSGHALEGNPQLFHPPNREFLIKLRTELVQRLEMGAAAGQGGQPAQRGAWVALAPIGRAPKTRQALNPGGCGIGRKEGAVDCADRRSQDVIGDDLALCERPEHPHLVCSEHATAAQHEGKL